MHTLAEEIVHFTDSYLRDAKCSNYHGGMKRNMIKDAFQEELEESLLHRGIQNDNMKNTISKSASLPIQGGMQFACFGITIVPGYF